MLCKSERHQNGYKFVTARQERGALHANSLHLSDYLLALEGQTAMHCDCIGLLISSPI